MIRIPRVLGRGGHFGGSVAVAALLAVLAGSACTRLPPPPAGPSVGVSLRDYRITTSATSVSPGFVTFNVYSRGPTTHEVNVVRTSLAHDALPLGPDGISVNEESPQLHWAGSRENLDIGDSTRLTLKLSPGHYVLFCNMEGHYMAGMSSSLTVP